jgi:lysophospholipase L1-like esterase
MHRVFARAAVALLCSGMTAAGNAAATRAATAPLVISLGDSIAYGYGLPSRSTQSYAALYAASLGGTLVNLGVPGTACQDVMEQQVPHMPLGAAVVIVNCGTNDVGGFDFTPPKVTRVPAATATELAGYEKQFAHLIALVRSKEPSAKIYLINLRHWQRMGGPEPAQFARDVDAWNAMLRATKLPVIDLSTDRRMYDPANFLSDCIHPNVAGSKAIASHFTAAGL